MRIRNGQVDALKRYGQWLVNTRSLQEYLRQGDPPKSMPYTIPQASR